MSDKPNMITEFKHPEDEVLNKLVQQFIALIKRSQVLTGANKEALLKEFAMDPYYNRPNSMHHRCFDGTEFIQEVSKYAVQAWVRENQGLADLWKQAALNAANHSDEPHEIADELVSRYMDNFVYLKNSNDDQD